MKIAIGSDHAGFELKEHLRQLLGAEGHELADLGTHSTERCDYPDFCFPVARAVAADEFQRGIVLGGSGNGEANAANRVRGVRCGLCWNEQVAIWSRAHNDANCLSIGERTISLDEALKIVRIWLETEFEGGRHIPRIQKLDSMA